MSRSELFEAGARRAVLARLHEGASQRRQVCDHAEHDGVSAFAAAALDVAGDGLAVLPLGGEDGKVPLIKWRHLKHHPSPDLIRKLIRKYPDANIGVICGLSHVTVVDIDDPELLSPMIARFGETPLKIATPRGGVHLWYRNSGEGCPNLRESEGLEVDIKGNGGQVAVPPSVRFSGEHAGCRYSFLAGFWENVPHLPPIRAGALSGFSQKLPRPLPAVKQGHRNDALFSQLLRHVKCCDDIDALVDVAQTVNATFNPPLSAAEVEKTVSSVWQYESTGRNWVGKERRVHIFKSEFDAIIAHKNGADGLVLFQHLQFAHFDESPFAISPKAMALQQSIPGWKDPRRYFRARRALLDTKNLREIYQGGRLGTDPSLFAFVRRAEERGAEDAPNIKKTPSPPPPWVSVRVEGQKKAASREPGKIDPVGSSTEETMSPPCAARGRR